MHVGHRDSFPVTRFMQRLFKITFVQLGTAMVCSIWGGGGVVVLVVVCVAWEVVIMMDTPGWVVEGHFILFGMWYQVDTGPLFHFLTFWLGELNVQGQVIMGHVFGSTARATHSKRCP